MFAHVKSLGVFGLSGFAVDVEVDTGSGMPHMQIVGLPDSAVKESADRVKSALKNCRLKMPQSRVVVNLAPADIKKTGPVYDLPIFLAILAATEQIKPPPENCAFIGELSLDGTVRSVSGVLPMAIAAKNTGVQHLFVPKQNAAEAAAIDGINVYAINTAAQLLHHLKSEATGSETGKITCEPLVEYTSKINDNAPNFSEVFGQEEARRVMEIAASGGHNVLLIGPPGTGKSMISKRLPGILPPLTKQEAIECTQIYSVSGLSGEYGSLITQRPFRSPHHSVSAAGLAGGGSPPAPGEVSLAHNGVLFLDELPEFKRDVLEILRQPLEDKTVTISRATGNATYPCNFMLVAAMNPCPCGNLGHPVHECKCTQSAVERYLNHISAPLLDRIDMQCEVMPVEYDALAGKVKSESTGDILQRVLKARHIQQQRFKGTGVHCNAQMTSEMVKKECTLTENAQSIFKASFERMGLSARAYDRVLKVSRTIADLAGSDMIDEVHISEAVQYRNADRKLR